MRIDQRHVPFVYTLVVLTIISLASFTPRGNQQKVKEYFSIPGPVEYNKTMYQLSWSAHPAANYYKQEYIPAGEKSESFNQMIMVELVLGDIAAKDAVKAKIAELEQRKKTDPLANYQVIENKATGEYLLDFIMSQGPVAEWNMYRYMKLKDASGKKGIQLFAYSKRAYGAATNNFLKTLKTTRTPQINAFAAYAIPAIKLKAE
ncbi:MAG: hypothetical protein ABIQ88_19835 [Chitinophagaceae bacterium]